MGYDPAVANMIVTGVWETVYMTIVSSLFAYGIGIPLGLVLAVTGRDGIASARLMVLHRLLGLIINLIRSVPFIILLILALPFTRLLIGTTLGARAVVVPLVICAAPYVARMAEASFREVGDGVVEAARSMGASTLQIVWKVLLPEALPSLINGAAISVTAILGYSAMAGFVGGGGLGTIAINYGYYRYEAGIMVITVALLVVLVQIIQEFGSRLSSAVDKRGRRPGRRKMKRSK